MLSSQDRADLGFSVSWSHEGQMGTSLVMHFNKTESRCWGLSLILWCWNSFHWASIQQAMMGMHSNYCLKSPSLAMLLCWLKWAYFLAVCPLTNSNVAFVFKGNLKIFLLKHYRKRSFTEAWRMGNIWVTDIRVLTNIKHHWMIFFSPKSLTIKEGRLS